MKTRKILYADEGMVLTNGTDYGKIIYLAETANEGDFYEITETEYVKTTTLVHDVNISS